MVLYEDPPDQIPKIHVRSSKYMAWIAEMMLPSHLHVDRVRPETDSYSYLTIYDLFLDVFLRTKLSSLTSGGWPTWQSSASTTSQRLPGLRLRNGNSRLPPPPHPPPHLPPPLTTTTTAPTMAARQPTTLRKHQRGREDKPGRERPQRRRRRNPVRSERSPAVMSLVLVRVRRTITIMWSLRM